MSSREAGDRVRKRRPGVCHRCGWAVPVSKIRRAERARLHTGRAYGRLCDDCLNYLLERRSVGPEVRTTQRKDRLPPGDVA